MRRATATRYWAFRGQAGSRPVAWGTASAMAPAGAVEPVLLEPPGPVSVGPALTVGEPPPAVSTSLSLADPEGEIATMVLPDRRGRQGLTGRLYIGEILDGVVTETAASPSLHAYGNVSHQDGITTVNLQSDDSHILGASVALWNVSEVLSGSLLDVFYLPTEIGISEYLDGRPPSFLFDDAKSSLKKNQASKVPWIYDPAMVELMPLCDEYPRYWIAGVSSSPIGQDGVVIGDYGGVLIPANNRRRTYVTRRIGAFTAMVELRDALGQARTIYVLMFVQPEPHDEEADRHIRIPPRVSSRRPPAGVLASIIADHSPAGEDGIHYDSFFRVFYESIASYGGACGGVFGRDGATIREVIQHIAPICGLRLWLGVDDTLHMAMSGYSFEDSQDAKGQLPELQEGDVFPRDTSGSPAWEAEIVGDPDDDSAGVARVSIDWSEDQRRIYPIETAASVPVLGQGPGDADRERILSGAWIVPARAGDVVGGIQAGMAGDAARVQLSTHLGAHELVPPQKIRVSHPRGLGLPGAGWDRRLARVDQVQVMPSEDAVRLLLTDLGLSERMRLGLLDSVSEWLLYVATPGQHLEIVYKEGGGHVLRNVLSYFSAAPWEDGSVVIWTPGAEVEGYRRSWRVLYATGDSVGVDGQGAEDLGIGFVHGEYDDAILGAGWAVLRTDLMDEFFRENFIRATDKETGELESGRPGFQYSAY